VLLCEVENPLDVHLGRGRLAQRDAHLALGVDILSDDARGAGAGDRRKRAKNF